MMNTSLTRRRLLQYSAMGALAAPLSNFLARSSVAADAPLVTGDDPTAAALQYVDDASKASAAKPGSKCANCSLYQGAAGSAQGPCGIFPGKNVKSAGWCLSWAAKA